MTSVKVMTGFGGGSQRAGGRTSRDDNVIAKASNRWVMSNLLWMRPRDKLANELLTRAKSALNNTLDITCLQF